MNKDTRRNEKCISFYKYTRNECASLSSCSSPPDLIRNQNDKQQPKQKQQQQTHVPTWQRCSQECYDDVNVRTYTHTRFHFDENRVYSHIGWSALNVPMLRAFWLGKFVHYVCG